MNVSFLKAALVVGLVCGMGLVSMPASANLIVNGDFEASTSPTVTPTGWTNIGHSDGVIAYAAFGTPPYDGSYFYDFGGYGGASGPVGDGLEQTVATTIGATYDLFFGLSAEDAAGDSTLRVFVGSTVLVDFSQSATGTVFGKAFTTQSISYTAISASTRIAFVEIVNTSGGNNDPLIDCVSFDLTGGAPVCAGTPTAVPEPASLALLGIGLIGLVGLRFRRRS